MQGGADRLWSEFRLGYAPLLAQIRSEDADPETLLGASFRQFQLQRALPALRSAIAAKVRPATIAAKTGPARPQFISAYRQQRNCPLLPKFWRAPPLQPGSIGVCRASWLPAKGHLTWSQSARADRNWCRTAGAERLKVLYASPKIPAMFPAFPGDGSKPSIQQEAERDAVAIEDEAGVASIAALLQQAATARAAARAASMLPAHSLPFLQVSYSQAH